MILKAKERGDASQLARYLLSVRDNEHVELHEVYGFSSDDLKEAFREADAIARGTRCKNYLFSMSLNPPEGAAVSKAIFEDTADQIEKKLGLENQPRAIVFHEKDGRRHAHVVWSRIDTERMRAINLPHYKSKLRDVSRELYLEHGWDMPRGLQDRRLRDPLNFTRQEWQQAKRVDLDPREIKAVFRLCWENSDNRASLEQAFKESGFLLASGDRRGFVALDYRGEVYSLSRYAGVKTKELEARLGDRQHLPSVDQVKDRLAKGMTRKLEGFIKEAHRDAKQRYAMIDFRRGEMVARHVDERKNLSQMHERRWLAETNERAERLPSGFTGLWRRLTGEYARIKKQNEQELIGAWQRDRTETDALIAGQLDERQILQKDIKQQRARVQDELLRLRPDVMEYQISDGPDRGPENPDPTKQRRRSRQDRRYDR
ncbi:relaxase/mobilization nuclease domain-containing protein [Jannaschia sp. 2305UL9-9]|uniref:relaxase/mobilization nuclease domain-containing protein n=1 Tax=Jannaschia sp. 2305UL9-9 TaxID=3121638 RepID=UPI00352996E3